MKSIIWTQGKNQRNQCKFNENRGLISGTMKKSMKTIEKNIENERKGRKATWRTKKNLQKNKKNQRKSVPIGNLCAQPFAEMLAAEMDLGNIFAQKMFIQKRTGRDSRYDGEDESGDWHEHEDVQPWGRASEDIRSIYAPYTMTMNNNGYWILDDISIY